MAFDPNVIFDGDQGWSNCDYGMMQRQIAAVGPGTVGSAQEIVQESHLCEFVNQMAKENSDIVVSKASILKLGGFKSYAWFKGYGSYRDENFRGIDNLYMLFNLCIA